MSLEIIIFYLLLLDAVGANIVAWSKTGDKWWHKHLRIISRYFPVARGWTTYYLVLVLLIGFLLSRNGVSLW